MWIATKCHFDLRHASITIWCVHSIGFFFFFFNFRPRKAVPILSKNKAAASYSGIKNWVFLKWENGSVFWRLAPLTAGAQLTADCAVCVHNGGTIVCVLCIQSRLETCFSFFLFFSWQLIACQSQISPPPPHSIVSAPRLIFSTVCFSLFPHFILSNSFLFFFIGIVNAHSSHTSKRSCFYHIGDYSTSQHQSATTSSLNNRPLYMHPSVDMFRQQLSNIFSHSLQYGNPALN